MTQSSVLHSPYVSFATYRKSGLAVRTPVWIAPAIDERGGSSARLGYIFSAGAAGKVKRLRNNAAVELTPCDVRGKLPPSQPPIEWTQGEARLLSEPLDIEHALRALRKKYGWQMWIADVGARLTGKFAKRAYIEVTLGA